MRSTVSDEMSLLLLYIDLPTFQLNRTYYWITNKFDSTIYIEFFFIVIKRVLLLVD